MRDSSAIDDALRDLADRMAEDVCRSYKLDRDDAVRRILAVWAVDKALRAALAKTSDPAKIGRTRAYKDAASAARKAIYFGLRRYRADDAGLAAACAELAALAPGAEASAVLQRIAANHASTAERADHLDIFWNEILDAIGEARSVLDIGSGVLPVLFPFARAPGLERYDACDRDGMAMRAVEACARWRGDGRLAAHLWDLRDGWGILPGVFDVALMLKIVPVVKRQQPALLAALSAVPARRIVVTGSKEALVKRRAIARREKAVIDGFVRDAGFRVVRTFETPDEIGIVAQTNVG